MLWLQMWAEVQAGAPLVGEARPITAQGLRSGLSGRSLGRGPFDVPSNFKSAFSLGTPLLSPISRSCRLLSVLDRAFHRHSLVSGAYGKCLPGVSLEHMSLLIICLQRDLFGVGGGGQPNLLCRL